LKRHGLNILECKVRNRPYKRFAMEKPNQMVQMDILGPFYVENSAQKNYFISCEDDCSTRKVTRNALKEKEECRCTRCTGRLHCRKW
jgi:hypothetical protein